MLLGARPYTPQEHGDIVAYLQERIASGADNLFSGSEHYFLMRKRGLLVPELTHIRVANASIPDVLYHVNREFNLQSNGRGHTNMSVALAPKGVMKPEIVLEDRLWSAHGLKIEY